jgi:hypothetical protein
MSAVSDYAYIRKKLSCVRIGAQTDTIITQRNFQHPGVLYMTILEFVDFSIKNDFPKVAERKDKALFKMANEFISIAASAMLENDMILATKYINFCKIISREIEGTQSYQDIKDMIEKSVLDEAKLKKLCTLETARKRSYSPPDDYMEISIF